MEIAFPKFDLVDETFFCLEKNEDYLTLFKILCMLVVKLIEFRVECYFRLQKLEELSVSQNEEMANLQRQIV